MTVNFPALPAALLGACSLWLSSSAMAQQAALDELSLEDLLEVKVLTIARKAQRISDIPAAVTVVTAEDIRRSGARSIPDALRQVPGVEVAQVGAGRYAVSIRGFNGRFANALLVQLDGRSIYSPLFSGVFWESLNLMMEDIERIEVIRGPGAALWGANAVNGVINIVSRRATGTQGSLVVAAVDDQGKPTAAARYGTTLPDVGALRLFAKGIELSPSRQADGSSADDAISGWRTGFRLDSTSATTHQWTLQGEAHSQRTKETFLLPNFLSRTGSTPASIRIDHEGAHLLGRVDRKIADGDATLQVYFDHSKTVVPGEGDGEVDTADVDFQHRLLTLGHHDLLWGFGYRYSRTETNGSGAVLRVSPTTRRLRVASAFIQDEIALDPAAWKLTLGAKFEDANLSGSELQPSARLMWTPTPSDSAWAGWSRAVRTPSVGESDATVLFGIQPTPPGSLFPAVGMVSRRLPGYDLQAERVDVIELGYRRNLGNGSVEAVAFAGDYTRLVAATVDPGGPEFPGSIRFPFPPFSLPNVYINRCNPMAGRSRGLELGLEIPLSSQTRLHAGYTWVDLDLGQYADPVTEATARTIENATPRHTATLRVASNLGAGHELDIYFRYVSAVQGGSVPAYTAVDLRYGWKLNRSFELSIIGQNLFDPLHLEFVSDLFPSMPAYQPRRAFLQGTWRF